MKAVILAAGKGTRFGEITKTTPKTLIKVAGKPIIKYTLEALPSSVKEVILVIGHLGNKIKEYVGKECEEKNIKYVELKKLTGTGGAVWEVKSFVAGRFLVLNGDDIYNKKELENLTKYGLAIGLAKAIPPSPKYLNIKLDKNKKVTGTKYPTEKEIATGILLATGAYVLNKNIFKYKPVRISNGEYGLPQVVFKMAKNHTFKGVLMKKWLQINHLEDVKKTEKVLK